MTAKRIRALAARICILDKFDSYRSRRPYDMGRSRREAELRRLEEELRKAKRERELDLIVNPGDVDGMSLEPTHDDLSAALDAEARRRLNRRGTNADVIASLEAVRAELELPRPRAFLGLVDVDGEVYDCIDGAGHSRRRRLAGPYR
jgi:hypothetical protein